MNKLFIKIEYSNELGECLTTMLHKYGVKIPRLTDGDVQTINLDRILEKSGLSVDRLEAFISVIKSSVPFVVTKMTSELFFIKNASTGEWLKPIGEGYGFEDDIIGAAAFSTDNAALAIKKLQQEAPEFEYITVPMMDEIMKEGNQ